MHYALISVLVIGGYWTLSFFFYVPTYDNIDCYLPYKYFASYTIHQGYFPQWNPYQMLGYPAHSDMQNGIFSPFFWLLNLFGVYDITSLNIELVSYFIVAGIGAYKLSSLFITSKTAQLFVALCFSMSGFMVGTAQIMIFISGAAFLPHILFHYHLALARKELRHYLWTSVFIAIEITSSSPSFTIILAYILIGYTLYFLVIGEKFQPKYLLRELITPFSILLLVILLIAPYITSFVDFYPYFNRKEKLPYSAYLLENPFRISEYLSFLLPYTTISNSGFFSGTDLTMRNAYIGIIPFLLTIVGLRHWKKNLPLLLLCVVFFVLAAGATTPFYRLAYELPGFGLFRHPSLFRAHLILCLCILAGCQFQNELKHQFKTLRIALAVLGTIALLSFFFIYGANHSTQQLTAYFHTTNWSQLPVLKSFRLELNLNLLVLILLCFLGYIATRFFKYSYLLVLLLFLDLFLHLQISGPITLHYHDQHDDVKSYFEQLPKEPDHSSCSVPYDQLNEDYRIKVRPIWRNKATFIKSLSDQGHNQTQFRAYNLMETNGGLTTTCENPLFYSGDSIVHPNDLPLQKQNLMWNVPGNFGTTDSSLIISNPRIHSNGFQVNVENPTTRAKLLIVNQNFHHLWNATVQGEKLEIRKVNDGLLCAVIPSKFESDIELKYNSKWTKIAFIVSLCTYIFILGIIGSQALWNRRNI